MLSTRMRLARALTLLAACSLVHAGRSDDKTAPPPRPVKVQSEPVNNKVEPKKAADPFADVKAKIEGRSPEDVRAFLDQLALEWAARKGELELARQQFSAQDALLKNAKSRVEVLKVPEAKAVPFVFRAADVDPAVKVAQQLADYAAARAQGLEAVVTTTETLKRLGDEFDRIHGTFVDQSDQIAFAIKAALGANFPADKIPEPLTQERLNADAERMKTLRTEVQEARAAAVGDLKNSAAALAGAKEASAKAAAEHDELKRTRDARVAALTYAEQLRGMAAAQLADEFNRFRKEFAEKTATIKGDEEDYRRTARPVAEARERLDAVMDPRAPLDLHPEPLLPPLEAAGRRLSAAQQLLAARVRAFDERTQKTAALIATLDEQENKAREYASTLDALRRAAGQLSSVTAEIERRVGAGTLDPAKAPAGVAEASGAGAARAKFDAEFASVQAALVQLRKDRDALRAPDTETDSARALTAALLANVNERLALHAELNRLAKEYATPRSSRTEIDIKRADQRAADRLLSESQPWDQFLALDRSKRSAEIALLLEAHYKELIELDERADNLKAQRDALDKLVKLTRTEADDVAKFRALLEKRTASPDPWWDGWLAARLAPEGLKAEADVYHGGYTWLDTLGAANARRVQALTGNASPEPGKAVEQTKLAASGGEIGKAREELLEARARGLITLGVKIALVLFAAIVLPRVTVFVLRRAIRGGSDPAGNPAPVVRPMRSVIRMVVWSAATAVVLNILGFDVTALVAALAIGLLAAALAARPMIADLLGSVAIFAERRFKVGDVVRLGGGEPARVVGVTWRATELKNSNGVVSSVPNRAVADATVENLSRGTETYDTLTVTVSTDKDAGKVINVIRAAMAQCKNLSSDQGVTVLSYIQRGPMKVVQYRFWWFLKDYEARNKTRDEVFARIAMGLAHEDMTGIEISLA
jgi:small-conductance mechanosensitive channel